MKPEIDKAKLLSDSNFLTKCKDLAQAEKFEPVPPKLNEHWVTRMWVAGVLGALNWAGYEVKKKDGDST